MLSVDPDDLHKKGRAKGLICYLGYYQLGIKTNSPKSASPRSNVAVRDTEKELNINRDQIYAKYIGAPVAENS
ncbi:MAG: hypothetical protein LWX01_13380 [Deltaproteobacteria bacterium]|nr:hypothetical protein [Deltaproteobacteria bacterium]